MTIIEQFLEDYKKKIDFYEKLSKLVADKIEAVLKARGIKAIVSNRAKKMDKLEEKLLKRNEEKKYKSTKEIEEDIVDLAGVRVALYFPSDREIIGKEIEDLFDVIKKKSFPDEKRKPDYKKRFSGYWANHYRATLKKDSENKRFIGTVFEIQVASLLMHAWSEVEHDLIYKPMGGQPSEDELSILDEINGLVIAGEIALERLQKVLAEKVKGSKQISDSYQLKNLISEIISEKNIPEVKLGNLDLISNMKLKPSDVIISINQNIKNLNKEYIADSIIDNYLDRKMDSKKDLDKFIENTSNYLKTKLKSPFEKFIRSWILYEQAIRHAKLKNSAFQISRGVVFSDEILNEIGITSFEDKSKIKSIRMMRNMLVHGIERPPDDVLIKHLMDLKPIIKKIIGKIQDPKASKLLKNELDEL